MTRRAFSALALSLLSLASCSYFSGVMRTKTFATAPDMDCIMRAAAGVADVSNVRRIEVGQAEPGASERPLRLIRYNAVGSDDFFLHAIENQESENVTLHHGVAFQDVRWDRNRQALADAGIRVIRSVERGIEHACGLDLTLDMGTYCAGARCGAEDFEAMDVAS